MSFKSNIEYRFKNASFLPRLNGLCFSAKQKDR